MNPVAPKPNAAEPAEPPWHALAIEAAVKRLDSDAGGGLSAAEAERRRQEHGDNVLR